MLFTSSSLFVAALVGIAQAQTPEGFTPSVNTKLDVLFNSTAVAAPGQQLTKAGTATQPQIAVSSAMVNQADTYMFAMIDLDVPGTGSNGTRRTLLHALTTGLKATAQQVSAGNSTGAILLASTSQGPAAYIGPSPPANDTIAHRYVELLFQQPESFELQADAFADVSGRIGFDVNSFMQENALSEPLAANFFTVDGRVGGGGGSGSGSGSGSGGSDSGDSDATGTEAGVPSATSTDIAENTLQPFDGAAGRVDMSLGLAGLIGGLVLAAV